MLAGSHQWSFALPTRSRLAHGRLHFLHPHPSLHSPSHPHMTLAATTSPTDRLTLNLSHMHSIHMHEFAGGRRLVSIVARLPSNAAAVRGVWPDDNRCSPRGRFRHPQPALLAMGKTPFADKRWGWPSDSAGLEWPRFHEALLQTLECSEQGSLR